MRNTFAKCLAEEMRQNEDVVLLFGDVGYGLLDSIREEFPERAINMGASEQLMLGAAVGLSQAGKIPVCYTITSFLIFRGLEWIRNYFDHEFTRVILVGSGRNRDYVHDGFTHWSEDDEEVMNIFPNIQTYYPFTKEAIHSILQASIQKNGPVYINLARSI
jgi:transketolase